MNSKMRNILFSGLSIVMLITFGQCGDHIPDLKLPAQSTTGANTLGCLINNRVWTNYGRRCYTFGCEESNLRATLSRTPDGKHDFFLIADYTVSKKRIFQSLYLRIPDLTSVGDFDVSEESFAFIADEADNTFLSGGIGTGQLRILRYDTINAVVSGEFSGTLTSKTGTETLEITEGRFDVTLDH
jgi:hypothetical protein